MFEKMLSVGLTFSVAALMTLIVFSSSSDSIETTGEQQQAGGVEAVKKLDNLDFVPRATSHMGALEGCLKYLGIEVSPGWLYGSTGHAFILNIDDDLCGSGPHSWGWGVVNKLGRNIGYKTEVVYTNVNKDDFSRKQEKAWNFARKSIDDGFPCYGWHYDFMVINGYDDNGYLLSGPVDDAPGDWRKFGMDAVGFLEIWSIRPGEKTDDRTTIKDALSFAADMAKEPDKRTIDPGTGGLAGYDNWITALESGKGDAFGGAYNTAIWAECRRFAVEFLEEANQRTGRKYSSLFQPAIEQYKLVSDDLNEVEKLFPYKGATEEEWKRNMEDAGRRQKAVKHLKAAKVAEAEGLKLLEKIAEVLEEGEAENEELGYYSQQGPMTDPRQYADIFDSLPTDIPALCKVIRGFLLHTFNAPYYGVELTEARKHREWDIRPVSEMLDQVFRLDDRSLMESRPPEKRLTGICRHFATMLCAMLRHQGVPARARAGFVDYGKSGKYGEHWVCEYWNADQERWVMVDAGVDEYQQEKMGIDPHDVTPEQFIVAGRAWQLCRTGEMEPEAFGIFDDVGMYMVRGNVVQDLASLNKVEALPWDLWGLNTKEKGETTSPEELALLDRVAEITLATDERFSELHSLYQSDDRLRAPSYLEDPMENTNYGFRYDPMNWVESDETLQGALVRTLVLKQPHEGDQQRIDEAISKILAEQKDDGSFGEEGKETAGKICELIELGYPADKPEIQRGADAIVQLVKEKKTLSRVFDEGKELPMGIGVMRALSLTGKTDLPELHETLQWYANNVHDWINRGCPWGQSQTMVALSAGLWVADVETGLNQALMWVADSINGAGCLSYFDPWSFVRLAGIVDHPLTRTIVEKQLTLILRSQYPDGGWDVPIRWATNQSSLNAFRALQKHDLLEDLSHRPPLPPGWEVAQSIPAPDGDLWGLAWDGEKWWMCDDETHSAIAVSPENGDIIKKVKLPEGNGRGFGWCDGAIAVNQGCPWEKDPKRLVKVDPDTGEVLKEIPLDMLNHAGGVAQVDGNAWVVDSFYGWLMSLDASGKKIRSHVSLAGPLPVAIAPDNGALWHDDLWVPFFIKSGLDHDGQYLDCIEKPFREPFARKPYGGVVRGMGYDGENLWVLDNSNKRIVMLKKKGEE